jgi:hypothetical protein
VQYPSCVTKFLLIASPPTRDSKLYCPANLLGKYFTFPTVITDFLKFMKKQNLFVCLLACSLLIGGLAQPSNLLGQTKTPPTLAQLFAKYEFSYTKVTDEIYTIPFEGKALTHFDVTVATQADVLVMFVNVAEKNKLKITPDLMKKLLKLNNELDRVKIGLEDNGETSVRIDLSLRVMDLVELNKNLEILASAADEVYKTVKPNLLTPTAVTK